MHRGRKNYSQAYIAGCSYNESRATLYGQAEYYFRGGFGKYDPETIYVELPYKTKKIYIIEMYNNDESEYFFDYMIFVKKEEALERFKELKESNSITKRDNIKLRDYMVDENFNSRSDIEWLHSGWQFYNNKEKEVLRNLYYEYLWENN